MATKKLSLNVSENYSKVITATGSATTAALELTYDLAKVSNKEQLLKMIEEMKQRIVSAEFPPINT